MLAAGGTLLARMAPQSTGSGYPIWRSGDGGRSWAKPAAPLSFLIDGFVQFGKGNAGAPGGYVYALERRGTTTIHLLRAPPGSAQSTRPTSTSAGRRPRPPGPGTGRLAGRVHRPGRRRTAQHHLQSPASAATSWPSPTQGRRPSSDRMGVFEAPAPWGPWRTVNYVDDFLGMPGGYLPGHELPDQMADRRRPDAVGGLLLPQQGQAGACGQYHDRFNLMKATLTVSGRR